MAAPPNRTELVDTQPNPSNGVFKGGIGKLYDYVTGLLGESGNAADALAALGAEAAFPAGTRMLFQQSAAPAGWTKDTTHNNKALRIVSGEVGSGGSLDFTTAFASTSVGNTTLSLTQMPNHGHTLRYARETVPNSANTYFQHAGGQLELAATYNREATGSVLAVGGGGAHSHSINLDVKYVDFIIATKDA